MSLRVVRRQHRDGTRPPADLASRRRVVSVTPSVYNERMFPSSMREMVRQRPDASNYTRAIQPVTCVFASNSVARGVVGGSPAGTFARPVRVSSASTPERSGRCSCALASRA